MITNKKRKQVLFYFIKVILFSTHLSIQKGNVKTQKQTHPNRQRVAL